MNSTLLSLVQVTDRVVVGVRRVFFEFDGELDGSRGPIELCFDDASIILIDSGADGESLRLEQTPWVDPFVGKLGPQNAPFISASGKWTVVDVTCDYPFALLIGQRVDDLNVIHNVANRIVGAVFRIGRHDLRVEVVADDIFVDVV